MSSFDIVKESSIYPSGRVLQVGGLFDVTISEKSTVHLTGNIPIEEKPWNVGLIVGPSGCGKTTIAKELFGNRIIESFEWSHNRSILDDFPGSLSIKEITKLLSSVGFGSVPNWIRPYSVLSNGEKFRTTIARSLAENLDITVIDEFTSVVDRQVAQVASHTVQKLVRNSDRKFVAVGCHYDVIDWLQPDWIYYPEVGKFEWRCLRRRPEIELKIYPVDKTAWRLFSQYHYLSHKLHTAAQCFGAFVGDRCVAFSSYLHYPHKKYKNVKKSHRLVVHPDWQGIGIGGYLSDWLALYLYKRGCRFYQTVAHPALISYHSKSPRWKKISDAQSAGFQTGSSSSIKSVKRRQKDGNLRRTFTFCFVPSKEMLS